MIASEAGATVTDLSGNRVAGPCTDVVVAGPRVHGELLGCLRDAALAATAEDDTARVQGAVTRDATVTVRLQRP